MPSKIILIGPPIMPRKIKLFTAVCGASLKFQGFFHVGSAFDAWHWLLTLDLTNFVWIRPISAEANDGPKQSSVCGVFQVDDSALNYKLFRRPFQIRGIGRPWTLFRGK